jgi:hypothetical protein
VPSSCLPLLEPHIAAQQFVGPKLTQYQKMPGQSCVSLTPLLAASGHVAAGTRRAYAERLENSDGDRQNQ